MTTTYTRDNSNTENKSWWSKVSFKEWCAAGVSLVLIGLLIGVLIPTYSIANSLPQVVKVGDAYQLVDTFSRAKDLLVILFPLFGAVVTFWLGTAIEGKRADENQQKADAEAKNRAEAELKAAKFKAYAAASSDTARTLLAPMLKKMRTGSEQTEAMDEYFKILKEREKEIFS